MSDNPPRVNVARVGPDVRRGLYAASVAYPRLSPWIQDLRVRFSSEPGLIAAVSKDGCLYVGPRWEKVVKGPIGRQFVILHELAHITGRFFDRVGMRDHDLFNVAQDLVINETLKRALPFARLEAESPELAREMIYMDTIARVIERVVGKPVQVPEDLWNRTAEGVYDWIRRQLPEPRHVRALVAELKRLGWNHRHGSAADGQPKKWERQEELRPGERPWNSPAEELRRRMEADQIRRGQQVGSSSSGWGSGSGLLERFVPALKARRPTWARKVARFLDSQGFGGVHGWRRRIVGASVRDHLIPEWKVIRKEVMTTQSILGVVIDTSSSISDQELAEMGRVVLGLANEFDASVRAVFCNVDVTDDRLIRRPSDFTSAEIKDGGTDLRPAIKRLADAPEVGAIIVLTDAFTPWPDGHPGKPIIVALTPQGGEGAVPGWVDLIVRLS